MKQNSVKAVAVELTKFVKQHAALCAVIDYAVHEDGKKDELIEVIGRSVNSAEIASIILDRVLKSAKSGNEAQAMVEDNIYFIIAPISMALERFLDEHTAQVLVDRMCKPIYAKINEQIDLRFAEPTSAAN